MVMSSKDLLKPSYVISSGVFISPGTSITMPCSMLVFESMEYLTRLIEIALRWPLFLGVVKLLACNGFMPLLHKKKWHMNVNLFCLLLWILLLVARNPFFFF